MFLRPANKQGVAAKSVTAGRTSVALTAFYLSYYIWLAGGAVEGGLFKRGSGLCANAWDYFVSVGVDSQAPLEEMHAAFVAAGLNEKSPFNESPQHYLTEQRRRECHLNPERTAWITQYIATAIAREYLPR
ncbi:hypothetical protein AHU51_05130 [Salmonella enterica subsp. enterica serovar Give]|nr:hypothetical protein [Salmonella enterica subsp. enterica serovar Anatum]EDD0482263.1 hypothetical protein [Salmonella enterica subsp. enterica serovar Give]EHO1432566.1 hypothetical protein [Salmonella enterica]